MSEAMARLVSRTRPRRNLPAEGGLAAAVARSVGPRGVYHVRTAELRGGVLTLKVDSSAWLQELEFNRVQILKSIKSDPEAPRVIGIKFKLGRWEK